MPVRSPLTAYGNVRFGPSAMSFIHSPFFLRQHFCGYRKKQHQPNTSLQAEQAGAFFSSESGKKLTGRFGPSVT
jgi:hypothetical protein